MYVVHLRYTGALAEIDDALDDYRVYLERQFEAPVFMIAHPKVPRDGGSILAASMARERLEAITAEDPFSQQRLVHYDIIEFIPTRLPPGLDLPQS
jgi:uncharacterized protein YciI